MKIAILSDSHRDVDSTKKALDILVADGAEFIIHAGDIVSRENLELLKNSTLRYIAVYGNNDRALLEYQNEYNLVVEPYYFILAGLKFKLMHLPFYMNSDVDVVIYGHTHIGDVRIENSTLYLNSGEICARERPFSTAMMLYITDDEFVVTQYERAIEQNEFKKSVSKFKRDFNE